MWTGSKAAPVEERVIQENIMTGGGGYNVYTFTNTQIPTPMLKAIAANVHICGRSKMMESSDLFKRDSVESI